jgi:hypothetical protein
MVADSYILHHRVDIARQQLSSFLATYEGRQELTRILATIRKRQLDAHEMQRPMEMDRLARALDLTIDIVLPTATPTAVAIAPTPSPSTALRTGQLPEQRVLASGIILILALGITVVLALMSVVGRRREHVERRAPVRIRPRRIATAREAEQFVASYTLGDDDFRAEYPLRDPAGQSIGECALRMTEAFVMGPPQRIPAFELQLFDKYELRTRTKVLMSPAAQEEEALWAKLAIRGEPLVLQPGDVIELETANLKLRAEVRNLAYVGGTRPPDLYFERLVVEMSPTIKEEQGQPSLSHW